MEEEEEEESLTTALPKWKAIKITELALWTPALAEEAPPAEVPGQEEPPAAEGTARAFVGWAGLSHSLCTGRLRPLPPGAWGNQGEAPGPGPPAPRQQDGVHRAQPRRRLIPWKPWSGQVPAGLWA